MIEYKYESINGDHDPEDSSQSPCWKEYNEVCSKDSNSLDIYTYDCVSSFESIETWKQDQSSEIYNSDQDFV